MEEVHEKRFKATHSLGSTGKGVSSQGVNGDLGWAIKASRYAGGSCATRGVPDHRLFSPRTRKMLPAASWGIPVERDSARSTDLSPMGVAAEVEFIAERRRLPIGLGRVGEED